MAVKLPNPKYIPKPYEQMKYLGQRGQIDVKFVPSACLVGDAKGEKFYQYTFIDVVEKSPYVIECIQTDNGLEFTNRLNTKGSRKQTLFDVL